MDKLGSQFAAGLVAGLFRLPGRLVAACLVAGLLLLAAGSAPAQTVWDGGSVPPDDLWSNGGATGNWSTAAAPGAADDVQFSSTDAAANSATVNNIVDSNRTIDSLRYFSNGSTLWQNTQINGGVTLTIDGNDAVRSFGLGATITGTQVTQVTISGGGTLAINSAANVRIGEGTGTGLNSGTLDMSGLATLTANLGAANNFFIGGVSTSAGAAPWTVTLADDSAITANIMLVGAASANTGTQTLKLGSGANLLNLNRLLVGGSGANASRSDGLLEFDAGTGTLQLRAADGTSRAQIELVDNTASGTGVNLTGTIDLNGHSADLLISTLGMARRTAGPGGATATFNFDTGTLDATSIVMGKAEGSATGTFSSTLNIGGGTAAIGGIAMAQAKAGSTVSATINLTGGTTTLAGDITHVGGAGTSTATINLQGGTLDMDGNNIGGANTVILNAQSGTLRDLGELNSGGTLTKTTAGTLSVEGITTYTGNTAVNAGILSIDSPFLADASDVLMTSGGQLDLDFAGTDTISRLLFDGVPQAVGTWGSTSSGATNQNDFFFLAGSTGILNVTVEIIPEPSAFALGLLALAALGLLGWRRRGGPAPLRPRRNHHTETQRYPSHPSSPRRPDEESHE